ncbi:hypothetical protein KDN34_13445 [Shewanella yunxiaonensis]|uniref:Lipoprotein n=1 Tax=Shewanella yunxiaonensis TaxID=2829809 RepID=A0ABX7YSP3_9GAMM|nr:MULTISPECIES: hypothetical protein [Shewanella]MDF0534012.1 hypothetical protein [Shewanella sp. A32]QUN05196.1 hypothetical protein KDN34_13445 [Shewanella yunxiaonensis]
MKYLLVMFVLLLSGCSAVPFSTLTHFATFDEQDFAALDPSQIRARLVVDDFVKLKDITLKAQVRAAEGVQHLEFPLKLVSKEILPIRKSWIFTTEVRARYQYELSPQAQQSFAKLQQELLKGSKYNCDVDVVFDEHTQPRPFKYSVKLMLDPDNGYITMIDNRVMDISKSDLASGSSEMLR